MFKAQIKAETLKGLINVISTMIDEVKFTISSDGMSLKAVDPSHVAMIEVSINKAAFESYDADDTELGIDVDKIKDVLKLSAIGDIITMEQDSEHGRLIFKVGNVTRRMNMLDTSSMSDPKVPQLDLSATIELSALEFQKGIKASDTISDHISFSAEGDKFEMFCEGDTDTVSLALDKSSLVSIRAPSKAYSSFPLEYLNNLMKAISSDTVIKIELDNDMPTKISFNLADGNGVVKYLLAPRIERD